MYVTAMVTKIYEKRLRRLYIKEWQDKWELTTEVMADRLEIARESYYRILREPHRINTERLEQLAEAMGQYVASRFLPAP